MEPEFDSQKESNELLNAIETLLENMKKEPIKPHYVFFGTNFDEENDERNILIKNHIQHITSMPCIIGDRLSSRNIQQKITTYISNAFMMIADIF